MDTESAQQEVGQRTLLVGTARSVAELNHMLKLVEPPLDQIGCVVHGPVAGLLVLPCLGGIDDLARVVVEHDIESVVLSLPKAMSSLTGRVAADLDQAGVPWRFIAMLADQLAGRHVPVPATASQGTGRSIALAADASLIDPWQLLRRRPRRLDKEAIRAVLAGRCVLITGAGGSIGSQLARLVAGFDPSRIVLVERSENALFEIDRQMARFGESVERRAILHDVTDRARTAALVNAQAPQVVFHAAAHKHVPMMEDHPAAALENNFFGTCCVADASAAAGVERFVMISTDKAVNPSSVMGASKRLAELYIQELNTRAAGAFSMVRFGNVLGSACSVLPIWCQQLAQGEPITVTHPDMARYFMTIPEAAGLVLQSAALAQGGEVFLLDMGRPVKIVDLAHRFLRAAGLEPGGDVPIEFTSIRPGEKLREQLAYDTEDMRPTAHASIHTWRTAPPGAARMRQIQNTMDRLREKDADGDDGDPWQGVSRDAILNALRSAIPEMVHAAAG